MVWSVGSRVRMQPIATSGSVVPFIVATGGIIDEAWCLRVKKAMMVAAFVQFLREYANDKHGIKPSHPKRYAMASILEKAAAYTEIGARCAGATEAFNVVEAASMQRRGVEEEEAYFSGLSRTCVIEGRIMVRELHNVLQSAIKMPLPKGRAHALAADVFYARQVHFHDWGMAHMPAHAEDELRQRFSDALDEVLFTAVPNNATTRGAVAESMETLIMERIDGEDEREDARVLIAALDECLEKAVCNEIPKFCDGCLMKSEAEMTHVEWIKRIRDAVKVLEQHFEKMKQQPFFLKDARYHMESALMYPCSKKHFDGRIGDVIAAEIVRFDKRMTLLSRVTRRPFVTKQQMYDAVRVCRMKMMESGVVMTAYHQATLSGMLYAMEPAEVDDVAYFCAAEFVGPSC